MNGYYCDVEIKGRNRALLFERLKKKSVDIYGIRKNGEKAIIVTVNKKDLEIVFAICGNTWYNKLIKKHGFFALLSSATKRLGLIIGAVLFLIGCYMVDGRLFKITVTGATLYTDEIVLALSKSGINKYDSFNSFDLKQVENLVFSMRKEFSFVTAKKRGNELQLEVIVSNEAPKSVDLSKKQIVSNFSGIIKSITVYRGTARKQVGDLVYCGEVVADNRIDELEKEYSGCLASFTVECACEYEYMAKDFSQNEKENALSEAIKHNNLNVERLIEFNYEFVEVQFFESTIIKVKLSYTVDGAEENF